MMSESAFDDPVIVFDVLRESATRLSGSIIARARTEGTDPVPALRSIEARIMAVDIDDLDAQWQLYAAFCAEREALDP